MPQCPNNMPQCPNNICLSAPIIYALVPICALVPIYASVPQYMPQCPNICLSAPMSACPQMLKAPQDE